MPTNIDKGKAPSAAGESPTVDPTIWKAIAGTSPNFPPAGSSVYYFFNGHVDQCFSPLPDLCSFACQCQLAAVNLHADPSTEQLFATFALSTEFSSPAPSKNFSSRGGRRVSSVAITLTKSDTNYNGKTFLEIPEDANHVFRHLLPGDVDVYDLNNKRWTFRHVVSRRPPQHLLTSGWRDFISSKMLAAGDAVVFVRDDDGIIFVGLRRCNDESFMRRILTASPSRFSY